MASSAAKTIRFKVKAGFEAICMYHYRAPVTASETVSLPPGFVFELSLEPVSGTEGISVLPCPMGAWEEVFAPDMKGFKKYSGYSLIVLKKNITANCVAITDDAAQLDVSPDAFIHHRSFSGSILGTAVGDAIGLPYEGVSARRINKWNTRILRHRFLFAWGMISDDTEHTCLVAESLAESNGDPDRFQTALAKRLRWWFFALPAGIGFGTLRAILKLCLGFKVEHSGVNSAGNGPMMRSAILGVFCADNEKLCQELVKINTRITHLDPRAERAAQIVAKAAAMAARGDKITPEEVVVQLRAWTTPDENLRAIVELAANSAAMGETARTFCQRHNMKRGVPGYCYSTLMVVLQIWMRHPNDYGKAISEAVRCGGDTDTVAAIVGGIVGTRVGTMGIPKVWLDNLKDWPRSKTWMQRLGYQLASTKAIHLKQPAGNVFFPFSLMRNLVFMSIVMLHGFRRLLPPY